MIYNLIVKILQRYLGVAQFGSALDWGSRGRKFKSCHSDQTASEAVYAKQRKRENLSFFLFSVIGLLAYVLLIKIVRPVTLAQDAIRLLAMPSLRSLQVLSLRPDGKYACLKENKKERLYLSFLFPYF